MPKFKRIRRTFYTSSMDLDLVRILCWGIDWILLPKMEMLFIFNGVHYRDVISHFLQYEINDSEFLQIKKVHHLK